MWRVHNSNETRDISYVAVNVLSVILDKGMQTCAPDVGLGSQTRAAAGNRVGAGGSSGCTRYHAATAAQEFAFK